MSPHDVILRPVLSEKALAGIEDGKYVLFVHPDANRTQIKDAIEQVFDVDVLKLNVSKVRGKERTFGRYRGTRSARKKAMFSLRAGQKIQQLEGLV